jgi:hypothetical protein
MVAKFPPRRQLLFTETHGIMSLHMQEDNIKTDLKGMKM